MIDPSKLTPEDLAAIKAFQKEQFTNQLHSAHSAAFRHLERVAVSLEGEAKTIRELLEGRAAYPEE